MISSSDSRFGGSKAPAVDRPPSICYKIDLAPFAGADLGVMAREASALRRDRSVVFTNLKTGDGVDRVIRWIRCEALLEDWRDARPPDGTGARTARPPMSATPLLRPRAPAGPDVQGALHLVFRTRRGVTYLAEQFVQAPFRIVRPFALEDGSAPVAVDLRRAGDDRGDAYRLEVIIESGARVILIGASGTKVHRMPLGAAASHTVRWTVMPGGALEYYPGLVIPFPDSEFVQTVDVTLAADARFRMLELWAMGRIERGEYLAFRRLSSRARVALGDRPCYLDAIEFSPDRAHLAGWGILDGYRYVTSGYWRWEAAPAEDIVRPDVVVVSGAPPAGHLYARGPARDGMALCAALSTFLSRSARPGGCPPSRSNVTRASSILAP